jgi:hypothetical protein
MYAINSHFLCNIFFDTLKINSHWDETIATTELLSAIFLATSMSYVILKFNKTTKIIVHETMQGLFVYHLRSIYVLLCLNGCVDNVEWKVDSAK